MRMLSRPTSRKHSSRATEKVELGGAREVKLQHTGLVHNHESTPIEWDMHRESAIDSGRYRESARIHVIPDNKWYRGAAHMSRTQSLRHNFTRGESGTSKISSDGCGLDHVHEQIPRSTLLPPSTRGSGRRCSITNLPAFTSCTSSPSLSGLTFGAILPHPRGAPLLNLLRGCPLTPTLSSVSSRRWLDFVCGPALSFHFSTHPSLPPSKFGRLHLAHRAHALSVPVYDVQTPHSLAAAVLSPVTAQPLSILVTVLLSAQTRGPSLPSSRQIHSLPFSPTFLGALGVPMMTRGCMHMRIQANLITSFSRRTRVFSRCQGSSP